MCCDWECRVQMAVAALTALQPQLNPAVGKRKHAMQSNACGTCPSALTQRHARVLAHVHTCAQCNKRLSCGIMSIHMSMYLAMHMVYTNVDTHIYMGVRFVATTVHHVYTHVRTYVYTH